jgi:hypothetical protein
MIGHGQAAGAGASATSQRGWARTAWKPGREAVGLLANAVQPQRCRTTLANFW